MNSSNFFISILLLNFFIASTCNAKPDHYQAHEAIVAAAKAYLKESASQLAGRAEIKISPLDHRLRLVRCDEALKVFSPSGASSSGKTTVGVRCNTPNPWTLYVSANITINGPVVVALRDLSRGAVIQAGDVKLIERDTSNLLRGHFDSLTYVIGKTLKSSLRREQVITPSRLIVEKTVKRGQKVTILAGGEFIKVRMKGKALRNGNPGDLIQVQNLVSKKKLEARVVSAGNVRID